MPDVYRHIPLNVEPVYEIPAGPLTQEDRYIIENMVFPEAAEDLLDFFLTEEDRCMILAHEKDSPFPAKDLQRAYAEDAFQRGVISKLDAEGTQYILNSFYGLLDVFAVSQTEKYRSLPYEKRKQIDAWYFRAFMDGLDQDLHVRPTSDVVVTYQEMLDYLDEKAADGSRFYLSPCDCKSLNGDCGAPDHTCISYGTGFNSYAARGIAKPLTLEEAKDIIAQAERGGAVHTYSDNGICNCCSDCCYIFRGQRERQSRGFWPRSPYIIQMDAERCIACGKCVGRCRFGVFEKEGRGKNAKIHMDRETCVGCQLCANTCPTGALSLTQRRADQTQIAGKWGNGEAGTPETFPGAAEGR